MHWIWSVAAVLTANVVFKRKSRKRPSLYLSFDDGPHPNHTPVLLDLLRHHEAKATFFLIGNQALAHPDVVRRILAEGHAIGNHSMTHPRMPALSARQQIDEIRQADAVLAAFNDRKRQLFRPPNGRATLATILHNLVHRQPLVLWSVDSLDYTLPADRVVERLERTSVGAGDIVLFHDDAGVAAEALRRLLPRWREAGLRFEAM